MPDKLESAEICEDLSLRRDIPKIMRDQARYMLYFHSKKAPELFPSWHSRRIDFVPPPGWHQMNPCVANVNDDILVALRCCNYYVDYTGPHQTEGTPYFSRTFLLGIKKTELDDSCLGEIVIPEHEDSFHSGVPMGFEDMRILEFNCEVYASLTRCTQNPEGWPETWYGVLHKGSRTIEIEKLIRLTPQTGLPRVPEKNWMPFVTKPNEMLDEQICFIYKCDPVTILCGTKPISVKYPSIDVTNLRGSTQAIAFETGNSNLIEIESGWLALTHNLIMDGVWPKYSHRFIWLSDTFELLKISPNFILPSPYEDHINGYQYIMGLCWHPDNKRLIISYSIAEREAWLATIDATEVQQNLKHTG